MTLNQTKAKKISIFSANIRGKYLYLLGETGGNFGFSPESISVKIRKLYEEINTIKIQ